MKLRCLAVHVFFSTRGTVVVFDLDQILRRLILMFLVSNLTVDSFQASGMLNRKYACNVTLVT